MKLLYIYKNTYTYFTLLLDVKGLYVILYVPISKLISLLK